MGTIFDVFRGSTHDYVDSPYWSLMQIKVKLLDRANEGAIMDEDLGKVSTINEAHIVKLVLVYASFVLSKRTIISHTHACVHHLLVYRCYLWPA